MLLGAYAATLGLDAAPGSSFSSDEARVLMATDALVHHRTVDLREEYRLRTYARWTRGTLEPIAGLTAGRLHEPPGVGLPLLLAPAYAVAGTTGVQLFVAVLMALAFVAAAALARRLVPDPWATAGALAAGLSPPAIAWSTSVTPETVAAAVLAGAALFCLRVRDRPAFGHAAVAALLIGMLPWLSMKFLPVAALCALALARWLRRRSRGMAAFGALEIILVSVVTLVTVNERLYGGLSPYAAVPGDPTGASGVLDHLARAPRVVTALFDPDGGLFVYAPAGVLVLLALVLLARSLRERLAVALPDVVHVEVTAGFLAALCGTQLLVAVFGAPSLEGAWFPGRDLVPVLPAGAALAAWALRHTPRLGGVLMAATAAAGLWLLIGARVGDGVGLAPPHGPLPWGGADVVVTVAVAAAGAFLLGREAWRERALRRDTAAVA